MNVFDIEVFEKLADQFEAQEKEFDKRGLISVLKSDMCNPIGEAFGEWKRKNRLDGDEKTLWGKYLTEIIAELYLHNSSSNEYLDFLNDNTLNFAEYANQWWKDNEWKFRTRKADGRATPVSKENLTGNARARYNGLERACKDLVYVFGRPFNQITKHELSEFIFTKSSGNTLPSTADRYELLSKMFGGEALSGIAFNFAHSSGFGQTIQKSWVPKNKMNFQGTNWIDLFSAINYISRCSTQNAEHIASLFEDDAREKIATVKYLVGCEDECSLYVRDANDFCAYIAILGCKTQVWYKNILKKINEILDNQQNRDGFWGETENENSMPEPMTEIEVYENMQRNFGGCDWNVRQDEIIEWVACNRDYFCEGKRIHSYAAIKTYFDVCDGNCQNDREHIEERCNNYEDSYYYEPQRDFDRIEKNILLTLTVGIQNMIESIDSLSEELKITTLYRKICSVLEINASEDDCQDRYEKYRVDEELSAEMPFNPLLRAALICDLLESGKFGEEEISDIVKKCGFIALSPQYNPFDWYIHQYIQNFLE